MKKDFVSLQNDFAFKHVMKNETVLRGFLGAVFKINPSSITDIQYNDPHLDKAFAEDKQGILDVNVTITINHIRLINIELQVRPFTSWTDRTLFYNLKQFVDQGRSGDNYDLFNPCVHIGILGFTPTDLEAKFYSKFMLLDCDTYQLYSDKITLHMIQLNQLKYVRDEDKDELYQWAELLSARSQEEYEMIASQNEYLTAALDELEQLNQDPALKKAYLQRQMAIMDEATQKAAHLKEGREEGIEIGMEKGIDKFSKLINCLIEDNKADQIPEITHNTKLRNELFKKYNITYQ